MIVDTPTIVTFAVYIVLMLLVGWLGYRSTSNLSDYILGGRRLGSFVTALSAGASDMSGWLLMGLPGAIFLSGVSQSWIAIGLIIGQWCNWKFVAGRLRIYTEKCDNALTLADYFSVRFKDKSSILRIFTAAVILVFFTLYCASGVVAGARLFESMFGMPYNTALWIGALATITYVFIGGFLAVSWTDTIQASLMITALIITPLMVIYSGGGVAQSFADTVAVKPGFFSLTHDLDTLAIISLAAWGLGYVGQPHILVRFMAAESAAKIPAARRIGMTWMVVCLAGAVAVGVFGWSYFANNPAIAGAVGKNSELVFIELVRNLFNPWIAGVFLAAILAAIMSTLSCQLLVTSSALTEDIYRAFLRKTASQKELVWCGRIMVLVVAVIAIVIAMNPNSKVLKMVSDAWAGFGAAFGPAVVLSLFWPRMTRNGAAAGMFVGAATVLLMILFKHHLPFAIYEIIPGFVLGGITIVVVSLLGKPPAKEIVERHEAVDAEVRGM
ncbi:sodium/proline symporter [Ereboglobus sp. PH5-5]|uniref:sodium/proline symporter PutP n=1 Tax=Ereboglobus sp. PH5-5 TaxID=2940529 RepID=UPI002406A0F9|nr:sodium/proline symporter PutP [Ereboglobus sp. PH5-5]MDF9833546.1 sodium/proline symporter [Ereboglobus sp. PH5-5]